MDPSLPETAGHAPRRTDAVPLQSVLARVERLADDFSSACKPLTELAKKLTGEPVVERSPLVSLSALLHPAYEPGDGSADGAQMVEMAWWHPVMGCDSLQIVVDNARAALAQPVGEQPAPPTEGEGLTDKELFRIASDRQALYIADCVDYDNCSEVVAAMRAAIAADRARYSHQPAPPDAGEVGELARLLRLDAHFERGDGMPQAAARFDRAADLLERLASPACVVLKPSPELIEAFQDALPGRIEPLLEQRHPAPVPVTERLPGPEDCDAEGRVWWLGVDTWMLRSYALIEGTAIPLGTHWLPATALPLPQGEVE